MFKKSLLAGVALVGISGLASAKLLVSQNVEFTTTFNSNPTILAIGMDGNGQLEYSLNVVVKKAGLYALTYSAVCSASTNLNRAEVDIDIVVNGLVYQPTADTTDTMCSSMASGIFQEKWRAAYTIGIPLQAGANTLAIYGRVVNGTQGSLGHSRLLIED